MREIFEERFLDAKFPHYWEVKADGGHFNITFLEQKTLFNLFLFLTCIPAGIVQFL